jgi:RNA polymerase sigma-70 factor (ECF subfamily)
MATVNDQHYINQVLKGDPYAFAALVDRYKNMVYTLTLRMIKSREEAEELSQDTFMKAYRSLDKFREESKFSTWLYKIAYNTCLDRIKKNKRQQYTIAIDEYTEQEFAALSNIFDAIEDKERKQMLQDCLDLLPGGDSFLLTLFYFEEQSVKEIAKITGDTSSHIKVKLFRSRKKLAAVLKVQLEPEIINYESERR